MRTSDDFIVAEALAAKIFGEDVQIAERFPGADLVGLSYEPPFDFIPGSEYGEKGHTVLAADFVTAEDGTGLVHTAIAFGEDDFRLGEANDLEPINPVLPDGTYDKRITPWAGVKVKDADEPILEDLRSRGKLLKAEPYEHSYPHCWRCNTPLLYYAKPSWYIATSQIKDRLLASNESGQLAAPARQARTLRQLARGQRRLGAVARALLGHAFACMEVSRWTPPCGRLTVRARGGLGSHAGGPAPAVRRRRHVRVP